MIRRTFTIVAISLALSSSLYAQSPRVSPIRHGTGAVSGSCGLGRLYVDDATGNIQACVLGVWGTPVGAGTFPTGSGAAGRLSLWSSASALTSDASATYSGSTTTLEFRIPALRLNKSIGAVSTDSLVLENTTAATVGAQKWSPRLRWSGRGWKTDPTAGSQTVDWIAELQPVQGAEHPVANLVFSTQADSGGYTPMFTLNSSSGAVVGGSVAANNFIFANDTFLSAWNFAGTGTVNILKIGTDDEVTMQGNLSVPGYLVLGPSGDPALHAKHTGYAGGAAIGVAKLDSDGHLLLGYGEGAGPLDVSIMGGALVASGTNITATASTESVAIDGTAHSITSTAATSLVNVTPLWGTGNNGDRLNINGSGRISKYSNAAPLDGEMLIGDTTDGSFKTGSITGGAGITVTPSAGAIALSLTKGTINVSATASTGTITDASISASSNIVATAQTNDATCAVKSVVSGSGAATVNMTAACTAQTTVFYIVSY